MKRLALLTVLFGLAVTSVASADDRRFDNDYSARDADRGWFTRHVPYRYEHDRDRDGRDDRERYDRGGRIDKHRWVPIARGYSASTDKQSINMTRHAGYNRIRVEGVRGAPVIQKVVIEYVGDPNAQAVELNSRLTRGQGETIRLNGNGRRINRIVVYTEPTYRGAYSIYGA